MGSRHRRISVDFAGRDIREGFPPAHRSMRFRIQAAAANLQRRAGKAVPSRLSLPALAITGALFATNPPMHAQSIDPWRSCATRLITSLPPTQTPRGPVQAAKVDDKGVTTKEIVETKDGGVARLVSVDDKPLTPQQRQKESDRLNNLLSHPDEQEHRRKREKEDADRADEMVRLLPDAFNYKFAGMVQGPNGPAYRLSFEPNPKFDPPDREAEVYHGMVGELWIDKGQKRLVKIDAHLIADVDFGWGILGRLYKGGSIMVEQADVGHHHWEATHMRLNLTGKALMIKPLNFTTTEDSSDFQPVSTNLSYQDAVRMLLREMNSGSSKGLQAQ